MRRSCCPGSGMYPLFYGNFWRGGIAPSPVGLPERYGLWGRTEHADQILATMRSAGYIVTESNPFEELLPMNLLTHSDSRHSLRIRLMWHEMRQPVLELFPQEPGTPDDIDHFMSRIEDSLTPMISATSLWRRPRSIRRLRMWSPTVMGNSG